MRSRAGYARALIFGMGLQGTHMGNICRVWLNLNPDMAKWDTLMMINTKHLRQRAKGESFELKKVS